MKKLKNGLKNNIWGLLMEKTILSDGKYIYYYRYLIEQKIGRKLTFSWE